MEAGAAVEVGPATAPPTTLTGKPLELVTGRIVAFVPLSNMIVGPAMLEAVDPST